MAISTLPSCATKNERIIKKMERHSKRNAPARSDSRKVRQAIKKEEKRQKQAYKAAIKEQEAAIKRHHDMQTPETRARMQRNLRETNRSNKPDNFFSRIFRS